MIPEFGTPAFSDWTTRNAFILKAIPIACVLLAGLIHQSTRRKTLKRIALSLLLLLATFIAVIAGFAMLALVQWSVWLVFIGWCILACVFIALVRRVLRAMGPFENDTKLW